MGGREAIANWNVGMGNEKRVGEACSKSFRLRRSLSLQKSSRGSLRPIRKASLKKKEKNGEANLFKTEKDPHQSIGRQFGCGQKLYCRNILRERWGPPPVYEYA